MEKALSRRPGLLGTGAAGTAVPVAGAVSGSTTLRASQGASEPRPGLNPLLPPANSQVAPGVILFVIVLIVILTGWLLVFVACHTVGAIGVLPGRWHAVGTPWGLWGSRDGEQVWLAQGWIGRNRWVSSGWWPGRERG